MVKDGEKYLVSVEDWFVAPDGDTYCAVWGTCKVLNIDEVFNFNVIRPSTNWYLQIGKDGREVIAAGCRIHYAVRCPEKPNDRFQDIRFQHPDDHTMKAATKIWIAE